MYDTVVKGIYFYRKQIRNSLVSKVFQKKTFT